MRILALFLALPLAAHAFGQCSLPYNDTFSGSGALNGCWTSATGVVSGNTLVPVVQASGSAVTSTGSGTGLAVFTGTTAPPDQTSTLVLPSIYFELWNGTGPIVRADTSRDFYLWSPSGVNGPGIVKLSGGTYAGAVTMTVNCPSPNSGGGDTVQLTASGTTITCTDVTTGQSGYGTDSTFTTGSGGFYIDQGSSSSTSVMDFTLSAAALAAPSITPATGTYAGTQTVTITPPSGATACYTTDGTTPTAPTPGTCSGGTTQTYTGPFTIAVTTTVTAISTETGQTNSTSAQSIITLRGPETWYIRSDGGTRYSSNVTSGQCDGLADVAYPGTGTNQHCAFNDFRYLWSDNSGQPNFWIMAGGDTALVRGCHALTTQQNPSNPDCRLGWDTNNSGSDPGNQWCPGSANFDCDNPPIPAGTSGAHTRFLSTCAAAGNCQTGSLTNPKLYASNLTQLFGGFGTSFTLNFQNTQYVDFEGFEVTTHNGTCSTRGTPLLGGGCATSPPVSDFADEGIATNVTTSNITFQDVYVHGFNSAGLYGPIGGPIAMTRMFVGFNAFAGWNFNDVSSTPDAAGSTITANHVIMEGNGCQEEYPIVDGFPAASCWDQNSGGFGDSWSGQNTVLDAMYCNDCQQLYNTKDGFIGPHTWITNLTIINSVSAFNMGQQWKWGSASVPTTVTFENNLTVHGCQRMSAPLAGAPSTYNQYLSEFCRAAGDVFQTNISAGSNWTFANNSFVFNSPVLLNIFCPSDYPVCTGATVNWFNNVVLGYINIPIGSGPGCCGGQAPGIFYNQNPSDITINCSYVDEFGIRAGCSAAAGIVPGAGVLTSDPLLLNEPAQSVTAQSALDVFNTNVNTSSFYPTGSSPAIHAGTTGGPSTDYFGTAQTSPATIGAVVPSGTPTAATPTFGGNVLIINGTIN